MKILTKILNVLVVVFTIIGIVSTIYFVREFSKPQIDYNSKIDSLTNVIIDKNVKLNLMNANLDIAKSETTQYYDLWQKEKRNVEKVKAEKSEQNKVKDLPIDEMIKYILDYFETDTTQANLIKDGDSIYVVVKPKLMNQIGNTIAEHRDDLKLLEAYEIQIATSDSLVAKLINENNLLASKSELLEEINKDLTTKEGLYKGEIENKANLVKKVKLQRNVAGGVAAVFLVLLVL